MTARHRIIVGPTSVYVERNGIRSETPRLDETHGPDEVRAIAADLWMSIKRLVAFEGWLRHRQHMAVSRKFATVIAILAGTVWHPGPRPDLVSTVPWSKAVHGQWASLPHPVAGMLLRGDVL